MAGMAQHTFSQQLQGWLSSKDNKTLASLEKVFQERSFAIIVLVLMAFPALPIPTGGITHVFELIVMLLALEMMAGRRTMWLPKRWRQKPLGHTLQGKFIPYLIRRISWLEKFSRPRLKALMQSRHFARFAGLAFMMLALGAFLSPPFSGLDTLPALGAVIIALSLILGDVVVFVAGLIVGSIGIGLVIALGSAGLAAFKHFI